MDLENTGLHRFTLHDRRGKPHEYVVTEHPAGEGMAIMFDLLALGAPSVVSLAGAALSSERLLAALIGALGSDAPALELGGLGKLLEGLDWSTVSVEVGRALGTGKGPDLSRRILSRTFRDGQSLGQSLEQAYQANYLELLTAIWRVCSINGFFPVPTTSAATSSAKPAQPPTLPSGA